MHVKFQHHYFIPLFVFIFTSFYSILTKMRFSIWCFQSSGLLINFLLPSPPRRPPDARSLSRGTPAGRCRCGERTADTSWRGSSPGASDAPSPTSPACAPGSPNSCLGFLTLLPKPREDEEHTVQVN